MEGKENKQLMNQTSQEICSRVGKENILQMRRQRSREKMAALLREREEKENEEMKECHFKPKINSISKRVDEEIVREGEEAHRYDQLYERHKTIEMKKQIDRENQIKENAFRPAINLISKQIMESKRREGQLNNTVNKQHCCKSAEKVQSMPKTGRGPANRNI